MVTVSLHVEYQGKAFPLKLRHGLVLVKSILFAFHVGPIRKHVPVVGVGHLGEHLGVTIVLSHYMTHETKVGNSLDDEVYGCKKRDPVPDIPSLVRDDLANPADVRLIVELGDSLDLHG